MNWLHSLLIDVNTTQGMVKDMRPVKGSRVGAKLPTNIRVSVVHVKEQQIENWIISREGRLIVF